MTLLQHHKPNLAAPDVPGRNSITSQPFNRRPIRKQVLLRLLFGREPCLQDTIVAFGPVRDLKRYAVRSCCSPQLRRRDGAHRSSLSELMVRSNFSNGLIYSARLRPYYDACWHAGVTVARSV